MNWLKFIGTSFFSNKNSKEASKRSFWNVIFQLFIFILILTSFYSFGYNYSYGTHYAKATDFQEFFHNAINNENEDLKINLTSSKGTDDNTIFISANYFKSNERVYINTFDNEEDASYKLNGYNLIIDTRSSADSFCEFTIEYTKTNADSSISTIAFETYNNLTDDEKALYAIKITYTDNLKIITDENVTKYENYLNGLEDTDDYKKLYNELVEEKDDISLDQYKNQLYRFYIGSYYNGVLTYIPTIQLYYQTTYTATSESDYVFKKFVILTQDWALFSIYSNDDKNDLVYDGYYTELGSSYKLLTDQTINNKDIVNANIDTFASKIFTSVFTFNIITRAMSVFSLIPFLLITLLVTSLFVFCICSLSKQKYGRNYLGDFKICSSYLFFASVIGGVLALVLSFITNSYQAMSYGYYTVLLALIIRTAILVIVEFIRFKKNPLLNTEEEQIVTSTSYSNDVKVDLSKVDSGTKVIKNSKVKDDDDETMELM